MTSKIQLFSALKDNIKCTRNKCLEENVGYCLSCQISNPISFDHENFAKEFQTFPCCQYCAENFHENHDVVPKNVVSIPSLS